MRKFWRVVGNVLLTISAWAVAIAFGIACAIGVLYVFASAVDGIGERRMEHDRCMKHATNGYEIEQCR